ncbi:hypothetical protein M3J09_013279 [Ascochyta lentis]
MLAESSMPERRPSPGLSLNLSSNNPFRNRATSPGFPSPANQSDRSSSASRPMSRNPFLSTFEAEFNKEAKKTDLIDMSASMTASPKKTSFANGSAAEELFKNLTIEDDDRRRAPPRPMPNRSGTDPRAGHRPSRSDEERDRQRGAPRGPPRPRGPPEPRRPMQSSPDRRERRPRRNSDSSIIDKAAQEKEDRRRRERRREREERDRDGKSSGTAKKVRKPQGLDLIDKLDVTGIYGPSMIHHDGPYDAVQPHRNRKKDQRAPMHAFPVGSANNSLGGSGPLNDKIDLDRIHGRGAEGFTDFGGAESEWKKPPRPEGEFSAKGREDIVHGQQTHGLGTSTFLEGAPASRTAVEQDFEQKRANEINGLGRKKSIAQRFRGISQPRRQYGDAPRIQSPDARYGGPSSPQGPYSAGPLAQNKTAEMNPFFDEYNKAYDNKGATIKTTDASYKDDSPPRVPLHRAVTTDSAGSLGESKPTGFLGRMKSIKGGRRRQA